MLMRKRSVFAPTERHEDRPGDFQVPVVRQRRGRLVVGLLPAVRRTGAVLHRAGERRSRCRPPPKTGPCRPCARVRGPPRRMSPISRFGIRLEPGWRPTSSVVPAPNGRLRHRPGPGRRAGRRRCGGSVPTPAWIMRANGKPCDLSKHTRPTSAARRSLQGRVSGPVGSQGQSSPRNAQTPR